METKTTVERNLSALRLGRKHRVSEVFVPGGIPKLTYYSRDHYDLEKQLQTARENLCKLVVVTGATKSGKTVLANSIFPRDKVVWLDGGLIKSEEEFWKEIASQLQVVTESVETEGTEDAGSGTAELGVKGPELFDILPINLRGSVNYSAKKTRTKSSKRIITDKSGAIKALRQTKVPIVVDDFHYFARPLQGDVVRALKSLILEGCPVVFIAIPNRRYDVVKVEREMTGRFMPVSIPVWSPEELENIPSVGFPLLNVNVDDRIILDFRNEAIGSPHLMQEFCKELCLIHDIEESGVVGKSIQYGAGCEALFRKVAESTGRTMFDKLKRGPRQRADRIPRQLMDGTTTDIYGLVLAALGYIKPGLDSIDYEALRASIRAVSAGALPSVQEISRVLDHMAEISATDESSTAVLEWDSGERTLHITDPFFAYFLRWGT